MSPEQHVIDNDRTTSPVAARPSRPPASATHGSEGVALPDPGVYRIDPAHSSIEFVVRHLGLGRVRGRFAGFSGTIEVGDDPGRSRVDVTVDAATIDTGERARDDHLRSSDFLDVESHPTVEFHSTTVRREGARWLVEGALTAHGVTRPVTLEVVFDGSAHDLGRNVRIGGSGTAEFDRSDFGLSWNRPLENGGWLVGRQVRIELSVEAVRTFYVGA